MTVSHRQTVALLLLATVAAYANSLFGPFQFDDFNVIVDFEPVHSWSGWWNNLGHGIRPLLKLSYLGNWLLSPMTFGFHLFNLLVHLAVVLLVWRLAALLCRQWGIEGEWAPLLAAAIFALHPVNSEAVSYICGRSSSLSTLLLLAAILAFERQHDGGSPLWSLLLCAMAVAVKESLLLFPLTLLLWGRIRGTSWRQLLRVQWPFWLLGLSLTIWMLSVPNYVAAAEHAASGRSMLGNLALQLQAMLYLLGQWCWPLALNIDPDLRGLATASPIYLSMLLAAAFLCWRHWHRRPWWGFALLWLLLHQLLLYLQLPRIDIANERQLYLAAWPMALALACEWRYTLAENWRRPIAATLLMPMFLLLVQRNGDFRSEIALWQQTATLSPDKARVHNNLGFAYMLDGQDAMARAEFMRALQLQPGFGKAVGNLRRLDAGRTREPPFADIVPLDKEEQ